MPRNIDIGDVISKVFKTYGDYAGVLIGLAAIVYLIDGIVQLAGRDSVVLSLLATVVALVLHTLYTGMVVEVVNDTRDGHLDQSIGGVFNRVTPVLVTLVLAAIVAAIGLTIGFIACILPGIALLTLWAVVAPAIVVERKGVFEAFGRSFELVKTNFWQTLGVIVVLVVIVLVAVAVIGAIGVAISPVVGAVVVWVASFLLAPVAALAASILFFELRDAQAGVPATAGGAGAAGPPPPGGLPSDPPPPPPPPPPTA